MLVHNYHPITKEFVGSTQADPSPLEKDEFLIPANATTIAPPSIPTHKAAVFDGSWKLVDDYRGTVYYLNAVEGIVHQLGEPIPSGATTEKPVETLAQIKDRKGLFIKTERDRRIQQGGYKVGAKWYHSDTFSRTQQMGLVMLGANIPANTQWKTMDGSFIAMTQSLAGQIFAVAAQNDMAIFAAAEAHKTAMEASADPASYDFSTGWPKAFGE